MLAFMRVQPPVIRIAFVRRACGFREIVSAVGGSAIDSDAGTLRSKRNEFDRDDIGEAEYRRARYVDGAPVLKLGNHQDRRRLNDHFLPIFAQLIPGHIKYRARHVCGGAVTRRAGEIAGPRQGPTEISDAYRLVRWCSGRSRSPPFSVLAGTVSDRLKTCAALLLVRWRLCAECGPPSSPPVSQSRWLRTVIGIGGTAMDRSHASTISRSMQSITNHVLFSDVGSPANPTPDLIMDN